MGESAVTKTGVRMSDDEYENTSNTSKTSKRGDDAFAKAKSGIKQSELNEQLKEYIGEWRNQRAKEEEELKRLKDKQAKRKEIRAEQEKKLQQEKRMEEEKLKKENAEKKAAEEERKRKGRKENSSSCTGCKKRNV